MSFNKKSLKLYSGSFSRYFGFLISTILLVVLIFGAIKHQDVLDWWKLKDYNPPSSVSALADATTMTAQSRRLFYVSHPKIESATAFNKNCQVKQEKTIVLGCYIGGRKQQIYIFKVTEPRLNGVQEVTAAHEMLHAAYDRMSQSEKGDIDALIKTQMNQLSDDSHLQDLIQVYNKQEPGELYNEMHSILGTEYGQLSSELEQYYSKYFTNRNTIVGYANGYKKVFKQMKNQLSQDEQLLRDLKNQIDSLTKEIDSKRQNLNNESSQLDSLRSSDAEAYNRQVPVYNSLVNEYNQTVSRYKNLIAQYNDIVQSHNQIAADYNELNSKLNSKYEPIKP